MPIGETIPTIGELKGNTILELFKNGYNALKNAVTGKQNKLIAGSNIVIDETTNRISAIEGGTVVLEDYYTKTEVNEIVSDIGEEINTKADSDDVYDKTYVDNLMVDVNGELENKADSSDVYDKSEVDNLLDTKASSDNVYTKTEVDNLVAQSVKVINATLTPASTLPDKNIAITTPVYEGDLLVCCIKNSANAEVSSFVTTYTSSSNTANIQQGNVITANGSGGLTLSSQVARITKVNNELWISIITTTGSMSSTGALTDLDGGSISISASNSMVKIYRAEEVE